MTVTGHKNYLPFEGEEHVKLCVNDRQPQKQNRTFIFSGGSFVDIDIEHLATIGIAGSGLLATRNWVRKSCWQLERTLNIGLLTCHPVSGFKAARGAWHPTLVPGDSGPSVRRCGCELSRRRAQRMIRVGIGLPRHEEEVHGVVTYVDARGNAQAHVPKRRRRHGAQGVSHL